MKLQIKIMTENAAFEPPNAGLECARILHRLASSIENEPELVPERHLLYDLNGNQCGEAKVTR